MKNKEHHGHHLRSQIHRIDILDIHSLLHQNSETIGKGAHCLKVLFRLILAEHSHIKHQTQTEILETQKKGLDVLRMRTVVLILDRRQESDHVLQF